MASMPDDVILLDRPIVYLDIEPTRGDEIGHDDKTAEYVLAEIEDRYDELVVLDGDPAEDDVVALADGDIVSEIEVIEPETEPVVLLDVRRLDDRDLELA